MKNFAALLRPMAEFEEICRGLQSGRSPLLAVGLSQIHKAHFIHSIGEETGAAQLVLTPDEPAAIRLCEDINSFYGSQQAVVYPSRDLNFRDIEGASREYEHERLRILGQLTRGGEDAPRVVVASAEAALQHTMPPALFRERTHMVQAGEALRVETLLEMLLAAGYERRDQVEGICQFAHRGGIVDFFPPHNPDPFRIEFWGDEVDSIATFQVDTQRRVDNCKRCNLTPAREVLYPSAEAFAAELQRIRSSLRGKQAQLAGEHLGRDIDRLQSGLTLLTIDKYLPILYPQPATLFDYLPAAQLMVSDPVGIKETLRNILAQLSEDMKILFEEGVLFKGCTGYSDDFDGLLGRMGKQPTLVLDAFTRSFGEIPLQGLYNISAVQLANWSGELAPLVEDLQGYVKSGYCVCVMAGTQRAAATLTQDLQREHLPADQVQSLSQIVPGKIFVTDMSLSAGFEYQTLKLAVIAHGRSAGAVKRKVKKSAKSDPIRSLTDLTPGDYVVHVAHGIGIFEGVVKREIHGVTKDYIKIRYAGTDALFVPVTQLDLVSRYIGAREDTGVKLNKLNSVEWGKTKARVKKAVADMAGELIRLYSQRMQAKGYAFAPDTDWQREFEARFPYEETDDQLRCIAEIKQDMESATPMDRLLCGDVGFGKTEVAIRAAFKCVMDSKQCAVLVPTTILAWQHFQTFRQRMEGYPIRIELLSRFRTRAQQEEILSDVRRGLVDIVIGTHRIIQKDVVFKNLGLCIVDEEQRFGVAHKEKFKEMLAEVDSLNLSATPIPRTLNMAMSGIRDMSIIEEAPMDRHPVQTYVMEHDWGVITGAMQRELRRGGQVFYLHNRVETIDSCAHRLSQFLPDARIVTAHGKMSEEQLSGVWQKLIDHEIDILVCTTIIETGVDVQNCNTLIIEDADKMGLSQLYQLRGRVGRSTRRAFAYLTFQGGKQLTEIAQKRLGAIREFTTFGSGFRIAMRDLEIRGAGNVLGAQQHGHMEAVGYDMYLRLLSEAVGEQRGEKPQRTSAECMVDVNIGAHIPESYIENLSQRLDVYKKIAAIQNEDDSLDVMDELIDRFGEPPAAVKGLIDVALVRGSAAAAGIREISQREQVILLYPEALDMVAAAGLAAKLRGRVMVSAGAKPYISVKSQKHQRPLDTVREVLRVLAETQAEAEPQAGGEGQSR